jgi:peptidoglycan/LPS O-acetylase OafA/YrhL
MYAKGCHAVRSIAQAARNRIWAPTKSVAQGEGTNNFDTLRLIFAVLVVFSHSFPLGRGSDATEPLFVATRGQVTVGNLSVWAFFAISGFLITQSWVRSPSPIKFLRRRVARIYPGFIVTAVVSACIIVPHVANAQPSVRVVLHWMLDTLRLQTFQGAPVFTHNAVPGVLNGSLWSIPFEFWCYLGVLFLGMTRLLPWRHLLIAVFAAAVASHIYLDITGWHPGGKLLGVIFGYPVVWATILPFFVAGMLFQLYGGHRLLRTPLVMLAALLLLVSNFIPHGLTIAMPTCGTYVLMSLAYSPKLHPLHLGRYGDFSYGTYLYAFPIQQLLVMHAGGTMAPLKLFALAAPISLAVGALSWFLVERHFLSKPTRLKHEGRTRL